MLNYSILIKVMLGGKITASITEHGGTGAILYFSTIPALMRTTNLYFQKVETIIKYRLDISRVNEFRL